MARIADALVILGSCHYDSENGYALHTNILDAERTRDRRHDTLVNAHRMAQVLEGYVAAHPEQWLMFYPFWPQNGAGNAQE